MNTKKITIATVKAFARKNAENLFIKEESSFNGMTDCVESVKMKFKKVALIDAFGLKGVYLVGSSSDYIEPFENETLKGFRVWNCCGSGIIATLK